MLWLDTVTVHTIPDTRRTNARLPEKLLDLDQLKFWNTRGLALKIWCQMGFCKHDKSCDSLQVRRASRIRSKNEQSPRFVGSGESVLPVRRLTCGNGGGEGRRESGKQEAFIFCTWTKLLHSLLTAFVAIRLWL